MTSTYQISTFIFRTSVCGLCRNEIGQVEKGLKPYLTSLICHCWLSTRDKGQQDQGFKLVDSVWRFPQHAPLGGL